MNFIINKYYLETDSKLVYHETRTNGVDCWFDTDKVRQHRCLSFKDFKRI
jgi:hypothetical protein